MDFKTIVENVGKNPALTAEAGSLLALVLLKNTDLMFTENLYEKPEIKERLTEFKEHLESAKIIPAEADISLVDIYKKIARPVRERLTK